MGSSGIVGVTFKGVEFKPDRAGFIKVLKSKETAEVVGLEAQLIAHVANMLAASEPQGYHGWQTPMYGSRTKIQRTAAHGYAYTANAAAMYDTAANDTLHRAI